jgi:hypothetical protein
MMTILGIDLSLTSPACCLFQGDEFNFEQCKFFYYTTNKKIEGQYPPVFGTLAPQFSSEQERYHNISQWTIGIINWYRPEHIFIEDYAFASTGRVFNIAENCGILKYSLWSKNITFSTIPPTVVKKTATGKGNSNKAAMEIVFKEQTGFDFRKHLQLSESASNPVSDLIDSYYVTKAGLFYEVKK